MSTRRLLPDRLVMGATPARHRSARSSRRCKASKASASSVARTIRPTPGKDRRIVTSLGSGLCPSAPSCAAKARGEAVDPLIDQEHLSVHQVEPLGAPPRSPCRAQRGIHAELAGDANVVAAVLVQLEPQGRLPGIRRGANLLRHPALSTNQPIRATGCSSSQLPFFILSMIGSTKNASNVAIKITEYTLLQWPVRAMGPSQMLS